MFILELPNNFLFIVLDSMAHSKQVFGVDQTLPNRSSLFVPSQVTGSNRTPQVIQVDLNSKRNSPRILKDVRIRMLKMFLHVQVFLKTTGSRTFTFLVVVSFLHLSVDHLSVQPRPSGISQMPTISVCQTSSWMMSTNSPTVDKEQTTTATHRELRDMFRVNHCTSCTRFPRHLTGGSRVKKRCEAMPDGVHADLELSLSGLSWAGEPVQSCRHLHSRGWVGLVSACSPSELHVERMAMECN